MFKDLDGYHDLDSLLNRESHVGIDHLKAALQVTSRNGTRSSYLYENFASSDDRDQQEEYADELMCLEVREMVNKFIALLEVGGGYI